jgi:hypothetical protein
MNVLEYSYRNTPNFFKDLANRFHGYNEILVDADTRSGQDPTLGWTVSGIKGNFVHGFLNGPASLQLQVTSDRGRDS